MLLQGCRFLQQLVQDMNAQLTTFTSLEHYEAELGGSITPMIADKFEALDEDSADLLQVCVIVCYQYFVFVCRNTYNTSCLRLGNGEIARSQLCSYL